MDFHKKLLGKAVLFGFVALAAMLSNATSSKAQEVSPDHFTDSGVQNVHENTQSGRVKPTAPGQVRKQLLSSENHNRPNPLRANRKRHVRTAARVTAQSRQ